MTQTFCNLFISFQLLLQNSHCNWEYFWDHKWTILDRIISCHPSLDLYWTILDRIISCHPSLETGVAVAHAGPYHKMSSPNFVTFIKMTTKFFIADTNKICHCRHKFCNNVTNFVIIFSQKPLLYHFSPRQGLPKKIPGECLSISFPWRRASKLCFFFFSPPRIVNGRPLGYHVNPIRWLQPVCGDIA